MNQQPQPNNPMHGVTLKAILESLGRRVRLGAVGRADQHPLLQLRTDHQQQPEIPSQDRDSWHELLCWSFLE
ncbi:hypothetical protein Pla100_37040 [Neorhodopirellula pilleata]|uniref:Uncharacterized protein n=1 Tax=Neorhodopirellula pilleata TaxID=2714738 RepID=A0A5C6A6V0_9BACT|nr:hypothetical protein Pla100_37040 [Neorhodopirellula pilleata]